MLVFAVGFGVILMIDMAWLGWSVGILGYLIRPFGFVGIVIASNAYFRQGCRVHLREQLVARGIPICIKCGYDLTGNESGACPECGTACDPRLIAAANEDPAN